MARQLSGRALGARALSAVPVRPGEEATGIRSIRSIRHWGLSLLLLAAVLAAYSPALLHGGFAWDDYKFVEAKAKSRPECRHASFPLEGRISQNPFLAHGQVGKEPKRARMAKDAQGGLPGRASRWAKPALAARRALSR